MPGKHIFLGSFPHIAIPLAVSWNGTFTFQWRQRAWWKHMNLVTLCHSIDIDSSVSSSRILDIFNRFAFFAGETACGPENSLFLGKDKSGSLGLRRISPRLNITAASPETSMLHFFVRSPKKPCFKIFSLAVLDGRPKIPFSGRKILEGCTWLFLCFRNEQKLVETSQ